MANSTIRIEICFRFRFNQPTTRFSFFFLLQTLRKFFHTIHLAGQENEPSPLFQCQYLNYKLQVKYSSSLSRPGPWKKKFERLIFPTKYVIQKSLKFSHWSSKSSIMPQFTKATQPDQPPIIKNRPPRSFTDVPCDRIIAGRQIVIRKRWNLM